MSKEHKKGLSAVFLSEEAIRLIRQAPVSALACYFIGSVPFISGLVIFIASMQQSAYAYQQVGWASLVMALLFFWMKIWQCRYCQVLRACLLDEAPPSFSLRTWMAMLIRQGYLHCTGFFILPIAVLFTIPFGWVYAAYQNLLALDRAEDEDTRALTQRAIRQAKLWPGQNHLILWFFCPVLLWMSAGIFLVLEPICSGASLELFSILIYLLGVLFAFLVPFLNPLGLITAINIASALFFGMHLLRTLLGVNGFFSLNYTALQGSTFYLLVCGLTYLVLDPVIKAAYVLRCYYGESLHSGEDLRLSLTRIRHKAKQGATLGLLCALGLLSLPGVAAERPEESATHTELSLDQALDQELDSRDYTWRMPRVLPESEGESFLAGAFKGAWERVADYVEKLATWADELWEKIKDWFYGEEEEEEEAPRGALAAMRPVLQVGLSLCILLLIGLILWLLYQSLRKGRKAVAQEEVALSPAPDLEDENTTADQLPQEAWLQLAQELRAKGSYRLAARAAFLAILAQLSHQDQIHIARFKTNLDYRWELARHLPPEAEEKNIFLQGVRLYEALWYGEYPATDENVETLLGYRERLGAYAHA